MTPGKEVWYHDGMTRRWNCIREGHIHEFTEDTGKSCRENNLHGEAFDRQAVTAIYSK